MTGIDLQLFLLGPESLEVPERVDARDAEQSQWARVLAFPRVPAIEVDSENAETPRSIPRHLGAITAMVDAVRGGAAAEVEDRVALSVVAAGLILCTVGTIVTPTSAKVGTNIAWYAEIISTVFWGGACMGTIGLFFRVRRGLMAATVASLAFLSAPIVSGIADPHVIGRGWAAELVCAIEFFAVCVAALWISRPSKSTLSP